MPDATKPGPKTPVLRQEKANSFSFAGNQTVADASALQDIAKDQKAQVEIRWTIRSETSSQMKKGRVQHTALRSNWLTSPA